MSILLNTHAVVRLLAYEQLWYSPWSLPVSDSAVRNQSH